MFRFRKPGLFQRAGWLASLLYVTAFTNTLPALSDSLQTCLDSLAQSQEGKSGALQCLIAQSNDGFKPLFQALFTENIYVTRVGDNPNALVIPDTDSENGDTHAVHLALPFMPLKGPDGSPLLVPTDSLRELDVDRNMRGLLQPVLTLMDLRSPDRIKREAAILSLAESKDTLQLPPLRQCALSETDAKMRRLIVESIARLELSSSDTARRIAAAKALDKMHSGNALPELKLLSDPKTGERNPEVRKALVAAVKGIESYNRLTATLQNLFTGVSLGSILILMALGLAVIFGLMGVINMAHGEFMMIGAYATYLVQNFFRGHLPGAFGWFLLFSFPAAFLVSGGIGMLVEMSIIKRLYGRPLETLLATWGLSLLFIQGARSLFGDLTAVSTPDLLSGGWEIFPQVVLPYNRIFIIALTAVVVAGMSLLFYATPLGMKIRAVTQNRAMSSCLGVRTRRLDALTFGLGTGIAGIAGCALTQIGNVDPGMGQNYIVDSFMVVVTGGVGKLMGTVIAGMGIGSLNKFLEPFFQAVYAKVILLGLVILFLQRKPSGLFPAKGRNEDN